MPDAGHVWGAVDSKVWTSADFGASWQELAALRGGFIFRELVAVDPRHAWASAVLPGPCPGNATGQDCVSNHSPGQLLASADE